MVSSSAAAPVRYDPNALADEIARIAAHIDAAMHRLLACIRAFDASGEWGHQGAVSCAHWLSWRIGLAPGSARERVRIARALGGLPLLDDALRRGAISYSKVRAVTRVATPANEPHLLVMARTCTGAQLERLCRGLRRVATLTAAGDRLHEQRTVRDEVLENGLVRLTIVLHPDEAALVMKAIEGAQRAMGPAVVRPAEVAETGGVPSSRPSTERVSAETPARRLPPKADALLRVAETYLAGGSSAAAHAKGSAAHAAPGDTPVTTGSDTPVTTGGDTPVTRGSDEPAIRGGDHAPFRAEIVVHLDHDLLADGEGGVAACLDDGRRISAETFRRLACDGALVPVRRTSGGPRLDLGRRTRAISGPLRRALALRDRECRFPGCTNSRFMHAHHIWHWAHGGATKLANLVLLCSWHHGLVHEGGFALERNDGGQIIFKDPHGRPIAHVPLAAPVDGDGSDVLASWNGGAGVFIDAETSFPAWDGQLIDYAWALDAVIREDLPPA